ncbi:MAG: hypothetical protein AAFR96_00865 [Planctomycetota bacterium]
MIRFGVMIVCAMLAAVGGPAVSQDLGAEAAGSVQIEVVSIGVGGSAKASEWAGVQIRFRDSGIVQREVVFEVATRDVDGDSPLYQRTVTTNPGAGDELVWVYAYLQAADIDRPLMVSAYEAVPAGPALQEEGGVRFASGRLLGRTTTAGRALRSPVLGTMLVVGRQPAGLAGYASRRSSGDLWQARGHEATDIFADLEPASLPDRAIGYSGIETIVWSGSEPTRLSVSRAEALRAWVRSGGHLVVSLPASPQVWFDEVRNPLWPMMPEVRAARSVTPSQALAPLLTYDDSAEIPERLVVHALSRLASAEPDRAWPILQDAAGRSVVVRAREGLGMVTLIGFDVSSRSLASRGMPGMRPFWHRVLGRTGLPRDDDANRNLAIVQTEPRYFDADLVGLISQGQAVVVGVLTGFGAFGLYWLLAAPVGYAVLSRLGLKRHAWVAFVGVVVAFTAITWGGVTALRPREANLQAVVFLDSVEGTTRASARAFATVLVPDYGEGAVRVGRGEPEEVAALAPWADPSIRGAGGLDVTFPDVRGYPVSGRDPDRMRFPARSTVKSIRADWSGERQWSTFRAIDDSGAPGRLALQEDGSVSGELLHGLPGPLENVRVIVVPPQERLAKRVGRADIALARVLSPQVGGWSAGERLDLDALTAPGDETQAAAARRADAAFFEDLAAAGLPETLGDLTGVSARSRTTDRLLAAALLSRLPPSRPDARGARPIGLRRSTHGLDLGEWFTQPCVIVLGTVDLTPETDLPLPLSIRASGGWSALRGEGTAVVRWVYPLRASPPEATSTREESAADGDD